MTAWDFTSPSSWADRFGMVTVPLFGVQQEPGTVLLDGRSSFALIRRNLVQGPVERSALDWSWSSGLLHTAIIDPDANTLAWGRWDTEDDFVVSSLPSVNDAENIIDRITNASAASGQTVVAYMIDVLRRVRGEVEDRGGSETDLIRTYLTLIAWVDTLRKGSIKPSAARSATLPSAADLLNRRKLLAFKSGAISPRMDDFPIGDVSDLLLSRSTQSHRLLEPRLLIRHAAGELFQDAHIKLAEHKLRQNENQLRQRLMFPTLRWEPAPPSGQPKQDAHFTPTSLARFLVQESVRELRELRPRIPRTITSLDPACGSGVFLDESLRELSGLNSTVSLVGYDMSEVSVDMTRFCLGWSIESDQMATAKTSVILRDSLDDAQWHQADMILMNPPFTAWQTMPDGLRDTVKEVMGEFYYGRCDLSAAFVKKALDSLGDGCVLAVVVPSSFLTSKFAKLLRNHVTESSDLHLRIVGQIDGWGYFKNAEVEPAFVVISRSSTAQPRPTNMIRASAQDVDVAIRSYRVASKLARRPKVAGITRRPIGQRPRTWKPAHPESAALSEYVHRLGIPKISDVFGVKLGVKTGKNGVFVHTKSELTKLLTRESQWEPFRPAATNKCIRTGRLIDSQYVFYPYCEDGTPMFGSESELKRRLPTFYEKFLHPHQKELTIRSKLRGDWWGLSEPRKTWQCAITPRIISAIFSDVGTVAFDPTGAFAVVQGFCWNLLDESRPELLRAYHALLNSSLFVGICKNQSRIVKGGQVDFYPNYISDVPIPRLSGKTTVQREIIRSLAEMSELISDGHFPDLRELDHAVASMYGIPFEDLSQMLDIPNAQRESYFRRHARRWKRETKHISNMSRVLSHPSHQSVVRMGNSSIPFMLQDVRDGDNSWFHALHTLSEVDMAAKSASADELRGLWLKWGERKGLIR